VRRLEVDNRSRIVAAAAVHRDRPEEQIVFRAPLFVVASGYTWSSHLLLLSKNSKYPNGLANSSGLVGRYMCGHKFITANIELDARIYPGMNETHALISRQFFRCKPNAPYVRHDLRIWESSAGREPRLRAKNGDLLLGDDLLRDWRNRAQRGAARVRGYYDVHPDLNSSLTLDPGLKNRWGDPLPRIEHRLDAETTARLPQTRAHFQSIFARLASNDNGKVLGTSEGSYLDHPAGGCRMGNDPASSVCDSFGRTHDHENLFVVGSPTLPNAGCTNGTLTFVAVTLRSAEQIAKQFRSASNS
jgi:choline dehydrogenase-like flavoprotein